MKERIDRINRKRTQMRIAIDERQHAHSFPLITHCLYHIESETEIMARKVKEANKKTLKKAEFKGFANIELDSEQKSDMREWIREVDKVQVELDELLASRYKLTIRKSDATGGYQATAFCDDAESPNAGYILSAFAPHWWDALACLAYKHAIVSEGVWDISENQEKDVWG